MKKPQTILGVDPGLRHTGYCVLRDGKVTEHGVILAEGHGKLPLPDAIRIAIAGLSSIIRRAQPSAAAVEQVGWYGSRKAITLPLSHVAGGIAGYLLALNIPVYLLLATQRRASSVKRPRKGWEEHDLDAYELALLAKAHLDVLDADGGSIPRALLAVDRRKIIIPRDVHGAP